VQAFHYLRKETARMLVGAGCLNGSACVTLHVALVYFGHSSAGKVLFVGGALMPWSVCGAAIILRPGGVAGQSNFNQ